MDDVFHPRASGKIGFIKWSAIVCSLPSWVYVVSLVYYRFWLDGRFWPHFAWLSIPGGICVLCSLVSTTTLLILLNDSSDVRSEVRWFIWAVIPVFFAIVSGVVIWLSVTFGRASWYDYYGWN